MTRTAAIQFQKVSHGYVYLLDYVLYFSHSLKPWKKAMLYKSIYHGHCNSFRTRFQKCDFRLAVTTSSINGKGFLET